MGKRFLLTQNENNNGISYVLEDGKIINEGFAKNEIVKKILEGQSLKEIHKDDLVKVRTNKKDTVFIDSFYDTCDVEGRKIYYMYLIKDVHDSWESIVDYLEKDSSVLQREFNQESLKNLKLDNKIKKKVSKLVVGIIGFGAIVGFGTLIYLLSKLK
ncbi:hypothetical protein [Myroides odoratimimus]|nr:hypothetical protein [Myroides odoratimimus]MDM1530840.1 hypothetical protein [Myroides odoratimimus]